jgi:hypothetical protein
MDSYQSRLEKVDAIPKRLSDFDLDISKYQKQEILNHALFMTKEIRELLKEDKLEKTFRWLGFLQAILWQQGIYSIEEMKNQNR